MSPSPLDVLRDLQDRVAALEKQAGDTPGVDTLQPNVLTVAADGTIGANFSGHVSAQGVDLPLSTTDAYTPSSALDWKDTANDVQSFIQAARDAPGSYALNLELPGDGGTAFATLLLQAVIGSSSKVSARAGSQVADVIDSQGASSFPQIPFAQRLFLNWGIFSSFATAPANSSADYAATAAQFGFSTAIIASIMGATPDATWNGFRVSNGINNNGSVHVENGAVAQVFDCPWVALGN